MGALVLAGRLQIHTTKTKLTQVALTWSQHVQPVCLAL